MPICLSAPAKPDGWQGMTFKVGHTQTDTEANTLRPRLKRIFKIKEVSYKNSVQESVGYI